MDENSPPAFSMHGVRYQVTDVGRPVAFYAELLGFTLVLQRLPANSRRATSWGPATHLAHIFDTLE